MRTNELSIPQCPLEDSSKHSIKERVGRAKNIIVRIVRAITTNTAVNDVGQAIENPDESFDLGDLDLTVASQEEKARAFGITVEKMNSMEAEVSQYILECFDLAEKDVPPGVVLAYISSFLEGEDMFAASDLIANIVTDPDMLDKSVGNCLAKLRISERIPEEEVRVVIECVRMEVSQTGFESVMETVRINPIVGDYIKSYEIETETIERQRNFAIAEIEEQYKEVIGEWVDISQTLSDRKMAEYFERERYDKRFLTTFFDTCQFGLINKKLVEAAADFDRRTEFMECLNTCKSRIVNHLEPRKGLSGEKRFLPENCAFTRNGTNAFRLFHDKYLEDGETILVSSEEYGEMVHMLKGNLEGVKQKDINVVPIPAFSEGKSEDEFVEEVRDFVHEYEPDYLLMSTVSRRGTPFPLERISKILKECELKVDLILDGCQTIGRRIIDFNKVKPDVFIGSCQKGTDFGGPVGLLSVASDFVQRRGEMDYIENGDDNPYIELSEEDRKRVPVYNLEFNNSDEIGTLNKTDMARFMYGINPTALKSLRNEDGSPLLPDCMTMSVEEREGTNHALACNFLKMLRAINSKEENQTDDGEGRIKILHPTNVYSGTGEVQEERVSNIFELKIEGKNRTNLEDGEEIEGEPPGVIQIVERYGVTIQDYYDEAEKGASFRIAFHPFMNNESIKILAFALQECCRLAKEREVA